MQETKTITKSQKKKQKSQKTKRKFVKDELKCTKMKRNTYQKDVTPMCWVGP